MGQHCFTKRKKREETNNNNMDLLRGNEEEGEHDASITFQSTLQRELC